MRTDLAYVSSTTPIGNNCSNDSMVSLHLFLAFSPFAKTLYINFRTFYLAGKLKYHWVKLQSNVVVAFDTSCHTLAFILKGIRATSIRKYLILFSLPLEYH
ncbi:hypothetical protein EV213_11084 [Aureibacillus halotolerans]|uniref:Uncharacterized protein n=1 Tax=Aureibacillus halotolerans TaxID=1508390 RepID=A0A4R6TXR2_9BACI|nr:hypothetical protein EV213_11084 [Aureibacillus halotolerans]